MKRAFLILVFFALLVSACSDDSAVRTIRILPEAQLGKGIYRLSGLEDSRDLVWSPKSDILIGLTGISPYPPSDCPIPPACWLASALKPNFNSEIFLVDFAAGTRTRLMQTPNNGKIISEVFSMPDGEHVGYVVDGIGQSTDRGTWSIGTNGLDDHKLSDKRIVPVWSPDGKRFAEEGIDSIRIGTILGGDEQELFQSKDPEAYVGGLSWSADGTEIAFSYGNSRSETPELRPRLYLLDVSTGAISPISGDRFEEYHYPVFSPVDDLIVYEREQPAFFRSMTLIRDLKTDCQIELPIKTLAWEISWSPDGSKLLVEGSGEHLDEHYIIDLKELLGPKFAASGSICP